MLYTFQNTIINFAVTRCQYFLILFLGLSWLFTDKQSTAAFQASVWFYSSDKSSVSSYVSQSRSGKQTIKPLHSSLLPFAAQRVRSVRGKRVHNLCCAGQWLCVTCAWDSEGCALVRSVCEAGAWGGSWRFSKDTVDMLVHISVSCYFLKALTWCNGYIRDALARMVTPSCCTCEKLWTERENC